MGRLQREKNQSNRVKKGEKRSQKSIVQRQVQNRRVEKNSGVSISNKYKLLN